MRRVTVTRRLLCVALFFFGLCAALASRTALANLTGAHASPQPESLTKAAPKEAPSRDDYWADFVQLPEAQAFIHAWLAAGGQAETALDDPGLRQEIMSAFVAALDTAAGKAPSAGTPSAEPSPTPSSYDLAKTEAQDHFRALFNRLLGREADLLIEVEKQRALDRAKDALPGRVKEKLHAPPPAVPVIAPPAPVPAALTAQLTPAPAPALVPPPPAPVGNFVMKAKAGNPTPSVKGLSFPKATTHYGFPGQVKDSSAGSDLKSASKASPVPAPAPPPTMTTPKAVPTATWAPKATPKASGSVPAKALPVAQRPFRWYPVSDGGYAFYYLDTANPRCVNEWTCGFVAYVRPNGRVDSYRYNGTGTLGGMNTLTPIPQLPVGLLPPPRWNGTRWEPWQTS